MRRRTALTAFLVAAVLALLVSYVWYTQRVLGELQREAVRTSRMFSRVFAAQADTAESAALALLDLLALIREAEVPLIVTNSAGAALTTENVPADVVASPDRLARFVAALDAENPPVIDSVFGNRVHYGSTSLVRSLRVVPFLQSAGIALLLVTGIFLLVTRARAERERMWAGMARESAHQIGTPLSSLHGWIEVLRERAGDPLLDGAINNMRGDLERLERVAHRFERIGRPPRKEPVDVSAIATRVASYFQVRAPRLATPVHITVTVPAEPLTVGGDRVLIEWAVESLVKNAVDALSGVGGNIVVSATALPAAKVRLRVADDGPGVPANLRSKIFDAGFTTKEQGWGIGLSLTRRIVEENHGGRLELTPSQRGAVFDVILPV